MLLRPGFLTVRRSPAPIQTPAEPLVDESGSTLTTEDGLPLIQE